MGRALRKIEATKQELGVVLEQKEEADLMVQKLSIEMVKMHKDLEQKENILSAMLRKNKLDTTEKHLLLKEVKLSKAKRKQAEIETERKARGVHQHATGSSYNGKTRSQPTDLVLEYGHIGLKKDKKEPELSPISDCYSLEGNEALAMTDDVKQLESWVLSEAEKYATLIEQRHHLELDAFAEQMRIKDEKLETFRWQLMSMELESKRLQSHIEGMTEDMSQLRHDNMKLEALLLEREEELNSLKEQLASQLKALNCQNTNLNCSVHSPVIAHEAIGSKVINKRKQNEREQETRTPNSEDLCQEEDAKKEEGNSSFNQSKDVGLIAHSPEKESEDDKEIANEGPVKEGRTSLVDIDVTENLASSSQPLNKTNNSPWTMDLHALQVSYKIKRLKQQLLMLERLTEKQESLEDTESNDNGQIGIKSFLALMSLLNKKVGSIARPKEETKALQKFLDETFQLQRHIVATGQIWVEIQSKIASGFVGVTEEINKTASFDMKCFADRKLLEILRGH
ncbi:hypothetical protein RGQ29_028389 [Quercus rubra]|uniref:Uncharacterized protein n=1 Tax=Quercus rubra TaxID=3512 RepID=A0AAN7ES23_QUERU|nr:hypothetical protein RGQ29_028389 [Quercus rubra]